MKRFASLMLFIMLALILAACGQGGEDQETVSPAPGTEASRAPGTEASPPAEASPGEAAAYVNHTQNQQLLSILNCVNPYRVLA